MTNAERQARRRAKVREIARLRLAEQEIARNAHRLYLENAKS